jgi:Trypsin-like peptidase domain/NB-ARC domain
VHGSLKMEQSLVELLQRCTVKLSSPGLGHGTGFFVAPGLILTCAHVVRESEGRQIQVCWQSQSDFAIAAVERSLPEFDIALLRFTPPPNSQLPCVYLDEAVRPGDELYIFGYPDVGFPNGCPVTFTCEGFTGDNPPFLKFKLGQARPGVSGSPLLNQRTGKVCGIVKFRIDLGGGAVPTTVVLSQFSELAQLQKEFHEQDKRWLTLLPSLDLHKMKMTDLLAGFTLGSILAGLISGLWANNAEQAVNAGYKSLINYLKQESEPVNHELQKAVKRSLLRARRNLALKCRNELAGKFPTFHAWWPFFSKQHRNDVRWLNQQIAQWTKDLRTINRVESVETPISLPEEIDLLLTPEDTLSVAVVKKIQDKFLAEALRGEQPACYVRNVTREIPGLFQLVCNYFAEELKNNKQVSNIFAGELLVQINANLNIPSNANREVKLLTIEDLEAPLRDVSQVNIQVREKLANLENKLDQGFSDLKAGIEGIKDEVINNRGSILSSKRRLSVVLNTDAYSNVHEANLNHIINYFQELSGDSYLTIVGIERGSVILVLEGSPKGIERIESLFKSAQLTDVLGLHVTDIRLANFEDKTLQEKAGISVPSYLGNQSKIEKILQQKLNIAPEEKLFGVEENLQTLRQYLRDREGSWFISVTGEGGIGKTSIVEKLVRENAALSAFEKLAWVTAKRVYFNTPKGKTEDTGQILNVDTMIIEIANQLNIILPSAQNDKFLYLQEKLSSAPYLVVIDNLETLEEYNTLLSKFEANNSRTSFKPSKVIFTSRVKLQGINIGLREKEIKGLSEKASLELIKDQGNDIDRIQNATDGQLLPIYDKTEGNPLLIKLVVSLIRNYDSPLNEIISSLNKQKELLRYLYGEALGSIPDNAQKVMFAMTCYSQSSAVSYEMLKATSQIESSELTNAIQECVRRSLLSSLPRKLNEEPRYSIHNLLYEYING